MKHDPAKVPEGAVVVEDHNNDDPFPYKMNDVAIFCGIHRVTLLRMLQAGRLTVKPKWRKKPNVHRVFSEADAKQIKREIDLMVPGDREYVDGDVHEVLVK